MIQTLWKLEEQCHPEAATDLLSERVIGIIVQRDSNEEIEKELEDNPKSNRDLFQSFHTGQDNKHTSNEGSPMEVYHDPHHCFTILCYGQELPPMLSYMGATHVHLLNFHLWIINTLFAVLPL